MTNLFIESVLTYVNGRRKEYNGEKVMVESFTFIIVIVSLLIIWVPPSKRSVPCQICLPAIVSITLFSCRGDGSEVAGCVQLYPASKRSDKDKQSKGFISVNTLYKVRKIMFHKRKEMNFVQHTSSTPQSLLIINRHNP